ncbi:hypothetical protein MRB53_031199 [Persea americana]|uniref:Uncharacterized protein n=1 Tax=Persea americana TaxID=3435 RepID=A0ACC2KNV4_PERAE|nr:hypothetical protein MRB53_031199 [Persea americana]
MNRIAQDVPIAISTHPRYVSPSLSIAPQCYVLSPLNNTLLFHHHQKLLSVTKTTFSTLRSAFSVFSRMASAGKQFPPQKQEKQPGLEHVKDPTPQAINHEYEPSNQLQVLL